MLAILDWVLRFSTRGRHEPNLEAYARRNASLGTLRLRNDGFAPRFDATPDGCYDRNAGWSSLVARWAHNPKVGGSNPPPATKELIETKQVKREPRNWAPLLFAQLCGFYAGFTEPGVFLRSFPGSVPVLG